MRENIGRGKKTWQSWSKTDTWDLPTNSDQQRKKCVILAIRKSQQKTFPCKLKIWMVEVAGAGSA